MAAATATVNELAAGNRVVPTTADILDRAFLLAANHGLQTYDAIIIGAAAEVGCIILYSEDMQHGFEWNGVQIINPFA